MGIKSRLKELKREEIRLDFGCGPNKRAGFIGVDSIKFDNVDVVMDISKGTWPWENESVVEAHASHFIEHLDAIARTHFINELFRILTPTGKCQIVVPHWASCRAYGDPTHVWPPVSEFWFYYLDKNWRMQNAPHTDIKYNKGGFSCDFGVTWGYNLRPDIVSRNQEYQQFAMANYKEACLDTIAMLAKK